MTRTHFPALAVIGLLLAACGDGRSAGSTAPTATAPAPAPAAAAEPRGGAVPTLAVATFDGGHFDLAEQRGKWVVVNYWATWCAPCLKEIPDFSAFDQAREDVTVIGLAYEEIAPEEMRAFLEKVPASYPIAIVDVYNPPAGLDTPRALPTTYLIAPDGRLAGEFMGPVTSQQLAEAIAGHAAG